ncbi:TerC/Alx family metal homeostasis membrane protein [Nocardia sp. CDC159]|uniref:TerC/Alx family metal homeostasis membrane protein n=2 Tax=Nocardiaceae TaxID=85025 RepID=A0A9X2J005_9NOCA|nr:TerC/Alx family metal homeostasis membrane protein [Nocardia pulmonis]MCM6791561.1 TerC/Alx family metal homeostasis membrane protein [Nocardia sp. CDC159]
MDASPTLWIVTVVGLGVLIVVDYLVSGAPHEVSIREAAVWSIVWLVLGIAFGVGLLVCAGAQPGGEFFAAFVTEKSLSIDNLFVFVVIMASFGVPPRYRQHVLQLGVVVALALRAVLIAAGAALINRFSWVFYIFGALLIRTAIQLIRNARSAPEGRDYQGNPLLRTMRRRFRTTDHYYGTKLVVVRNDRRMMTPMLAVVLAIGTTDLLFAFDSVPAVYGLTQSPYIVFTATAFSLMGLRQGYFLVGGLLRRLVHLSYGLAAILGFIGVKLVLHALHASGADVPDISNNLSLAVICAILIVTTMTSLIASHRKNRAG